MSAALAGRTWAHAATRPPVHRPGPRHVEALADDLAAVREGLASDDPAAQGLARVTLPMVELALRNLAAAMVTS